MKEFFFFKKNLKHARQRDPKAVQRTQLNRSVSTGRLILCLNLSSFVLSCLDDENIGHYTCHKQFSHDQNLRKSLTYPT